MYRETDKYRAETLVHGGILLVRKSDNAELFFQPGDDAATFERDTKHASAEIFDWYGGEYFACLMPSGGASC